MLIDYYLRTDRIAYSVNASARHLPRGDAAAYRYALSGAAVAGLLVVVVEEEVEVVEVVAVMGRVNGWQQQEQHE